VFDKNSDNPRALFGGGRYNGLAKIFGVKEDIPAIGFAPGDETMKLFLEGHGLLEQIQNAYTPKYYLPLLDGASFTEIQKIANILRLEGKEVNV
jgi:histidyl-tRNA synthetase